MGKDDALVSILRNVTTAAEEKFTLNEIELSEEEKGCQFCRSKLNNKTLKGPSI